MYASPAAPRGLDFARTLALLACPGALLSHQCAARLHGFDRFRTVDVIEVLVLRAARHASGPFIVHSTGDLGKLDRVVVHGFPCTSGTRTVIDLAMLRLPVIQIEAAIDSAVHLGLSSTLTIVQRLGDVRGPGRWGAPLLDRLLLDSGGHTMLERRFLQLVRTAGLQRPRTQVIFRRDGRTFARVDFTGTTPAWSSRSADRRDTHRRPSARVTRSGATSCRTWGFGSTSTRGSR